MSMPLTVVATFEARPGRQVELRDALLGLLAPTRKETGCLAYDVHQSAENPAKFLFYETWLNQAAIDAHMKSPHITALLPRVGELCVEFPQIKIWNKLG